MSSKFKIRGLIIFVMLCSSSPCFSQNVPQKQDEKQAPILEFFREFEKATHDVDKVVELYDFQEMCRVVVRVAQVELQEQQRELMARALKKQIHSQLTLVDERWERHVVPNVLFLDDKHCEVVVRSWDSDGMSSRHNFWLHFVSGKWKIYDYTEETVGLNFTELGSLGLRQGMRGDMSPEVRSNLQRVMQGYMAAAQQDMSTVSTIVKESYGKRLPEFFESIRWLLYATYEMEQLEASLALEYINKAAAFQRELPMANVFRAIAYNQLIRPELAAKNARLFLRRFGDDPDALVQLAIAQQLMDKNDEALATLRRALDDTPNHFESLLEFSAVVPNENVSELVDRFAKIKDQGAAFQMLAERMEIYENGEGLKAIVQYMRENHPDEEWLNYFDSVAVHLLGESEKAVEKLTATLGSLEKESREYLVSNELRFSILKENSDFLTRHYKAHNDQKKLFSEFMDYSFETYDFEGVDVLSKLYFPKHSDDARAHFLVAKAFRSNESFAEAWKHVQAVDPAVLTEVESSDFAELSGATMYKLGQHRQFIEAAKSKRDAIAQVMRYAFQEEDLSRAKDVLILLGDDDLDVLLSCKWNARIALREERNEDAIALAKKYFTIAKRSQQSRPDNTEAIGQESSDYDQGNYDARQMRITVARAQIRLKKFDEAVSTASKLENGYERDELLAVAIACTGDREKFEEHCAQVVENDWILDDIEDDPDFPGGFIDDKRDLQPYSLRRVELMVGRAIQLRPDEVATAVSQATQRQLTVEDFQETSLRQANYVAQLSGNACLVDIDGFQVFVQAENMPISGDTTAYIVEYNELQAKPLGKELTAAIKSHQATLNVDIIAWPFELHPKQQIDHSIQIPNEAQRLLAKISSAIAQPAEIKAIQESDLGIPKIWNSDFELDFLGDNPAMCFAK